MRISYWKSGVGASDLAIWYLTQMRRWGQIPEAKADQWYFDTAKSVYRPDLYLAAAKSLVAEGKAPAEAAPATDGFKPEQSGFIAGVTYDGRKPNDHLATLAYGLTGAQPVTATVVAVQETEEERQAS